MSLSAPRSSLYVFPRDLLDEGPEAVARIATSLGFSSLNLALAYHQARDVVPHRRGGRLHYRDDGVFFTPSEDRWAETSLRPTVQSEQERDVVTRLLALEERPKVEGWTVFLHNTTLGRAHPDLVTRTCFGDSLLSNLCPAAPAVQQYAVALAAEIVALGVDISAEALSAQTFAHGHHHERSFAPLSAGDEAILGLCFCSSCTRLASEADIDVDRLAAACRMRVDGAFDGASALPATREALTDAVTEDVNRLIDARTAAVTSLTAQVAAVLRAADRSLSYVDLTGAVLGYENGSPSGALAARQSWRLSIDPQAIAEHVDSYSVLGYVQDPARLHADVGSVREQIGDRELRVILRPGHPDTMSGDHYRQKVDAAQAAGADRIDVYNYGMLPMRILERVAP